MVLDSVVLHDDEVGSDPGIDGKGGDVCCTVGAEILSEGTADAVDILIGWADLTAGTGAARLPVNVWLGAILELTPVWYALQ